MRVSSPSSGIYIHIKAGLKEEHAKWYNRTRALIRGTNLHKYMQFQEIS